MPAMLVLAVLIALAALWPELDLAIARRFYEAEGESFAWRFKEALIVLRGLGYYLPITVLTAASLVLVLGMRKSRLDAERRGRLILFLALSFALGPGLLVNGVLKEVSHRPRPTQVVEFGGASAFRPWYALDGACRHNCSFASGEVAGAAWLLAPASLAPPPWRALAIAASGVATVAVAVLRMAFGAHFASDAVAAALVTLVCVAAAGWFVMRRGREAA